MSTYSFNTQPPLGYQPELVPPLELTREDLPNTSRLLHSTGSGSKVHSLEENEDYVARFEDIPAPKSLTPDLVHGYVGKICQEFVYLEKAGITPISHRYSFFEYNPASSNIYLGAIAPRVPIAPLSLLNPHHLAGGLEIVRSGITYVDERLSDTNPSSFCLRDIFHFEQYSLTPDGKSSLLIDVGPQFVKANSPAGTVPINKLEHMVEELDYYSGLLDTSSELQPQVGQTVEEFFELSTRWRSTKRAARTTIDLADLPSNS